MLAMTLHNAAVQHEHLEQWKHALAVRQSRFSAPCLFFGVLLSSGLGCLTAGVPMRCELRRRVVNARSSGCQHLLAHACVLLAAWARTIRSR